MTKRILAGLLSVMMLMSLMTFTALAEDVEFVIDDRLPELTYTITDLVSEGYVNDDPEFGLKYNLTTDSVITFDFPLDWISVWDMDFQRYVFSPGFYDMADYVESFEVSVNGNQNTRIDNINADMLEKGESEINYFASGTKVKFNWQGYYSVYASVGFESAEERIEFYTKYADVVGNLLEKDGHVTFSFDVFVEMGEGEVSDEGFGDFTGGEGDFAPEYSAEDVYNTDLVTIDGIKDIYHQSWYSIGQEEEYITYCTTPLVITAKTALDDFAVYPMYYINEGQLWDEKEPIYPDGKKAQDYDWYESHKKYEAEHPDADLVEYIYADAGEKYTITKPGIYHLYATIYDEAGNYENDIRTSVTLKVTNLNAKYTDSKVLVDGEEYKFEAYNIEDNNYFKLRDIAMMLNKNDNFNQYINVIWDAEKEVVNIKRGEKYQAVGGEFAEGDGMSKVAEYGATELYIDGYPTPVRAYLINGNNYFKLRELAQVFGTFEVGWDEAANSVIIDTLSVLNQ